MHDVGTIARGARCLPPTEGNSNYFLNLLLWEQKKIENQSSNCNFAISAFILNQIVIIWNRWTLEWSKRESRDERCLQLFEHSFVILFIRWKCPNWLVTTFSEVGTWWIPLPLACLRKAAPAIFHGGEISGHPLSAPVEVVHHQSFSAGSSNCIHRRPAFWASRVWPIVFWKFWPYCIICQTFDLSRVSLNRPQFFVVKLLLRLLDYCDHDAAFLTGS